MNYQESIKHNQNCWKEALENVTQKISYLKGKKEALNDVVASLELIEKEQETRKANIKKKVYIIGKVTGEDKISCTHKFYKAKKEIEALGFTAINPLEVVVTWHISWQDAMRLCIEQLVKADGVYVLPCASQSKGAQVELEICNTLQIIYTTNIQALKTSIS